MRIKGLIFLPVVKDVRTWWLNQKIERDRKKIKKVLEGKIRTRPHTEFDNKKEMEKYLLSSSFTDKDGNQQKTKSIARSLDSYYRR